VGVHNIHIFNIFQKRGGLAKNLGEILSPGGGG